MLTTCCRFDNGRCETLAVLWISIATVLHRIQKRSCKMQEKRSPALSASLPAAYARRLLRSTNHLLRVSRDLSRLSPARKQHGDSTNRGSSCNETMAYCPTTSSHRLVPPARQPLPQRCSHFLIYDPPADPSAGMACLSVLA